MSVRSGLPPPAVAAKRSDEAARVLFLGSNYAGHASRFADLKAALPSSRGLAPVFRDVTGWRPGGRIERLPLLPAGLNGRLRAVSEASAFVSVREVDAVWTSCREELLPFIGLRRRPVVLDLDSTDGQLEAWAEHYFGRPPRTGLRARLADMHERAIFRRVTVFTPWSQWAAAGLERQGVDPGAVTVMPPGIDLARWRPGPPGPTDGPLRVLFVGGDFRRKGGDIVLAAAAALRLEVEVDVVTRQHPGGLPPNARSWRLERDDPHLQALFATADVLVLPSRAECFGMVALEAMASGLPVVMSRVGAAEEIVEDGVTGELIAPDPRDLILALRSLAADRARTLRMGSAARRRAEDRFDLTRSAARLAGLLLNLVDAERSRCATRPRLALDGRRPG